MTKSTLFALTPVALRLLPGTVRTQARQHYSLESPAGLRLHNLTAEPATFRGKKGLRLMPSKAAARQFERRDRSRDCRRSYEWAGRGSGAAQSIGPVHLASGVAFFSAARSNREQVRSIRRSRSRGIDQGQVGDRIDQS